jgi:NTP pyrophosphatase (non-canonical NTP hydrolase)
MRPETSAKIETERRRQLALFGEEFRSMRQERVLAVLAEEVGELAQAIVKARTIDDWRHVETELVHVATVAVAWLDECFAEGQP